MRILLLLLSAVFVSAQQTGSIEGKVTTPDGAPVSKATVRLQGGVTGPNQTPVTYVEVTASDGTFRVESVPPGRYLPNVSRSGYMAPNQQGQPIMPVNVTAGAATKVELKLAPMPSVSGTVTEADGEPASGVRVQLMRYNYFSSRANLGTTATAITDDRGEFRIASAQPGRYYLLVSPSSPNFSSGQEILGRSAQETNLPTYYPGSADLRGASKIELTTTRLENLRIQMRRGRTYRIQGVVTGFPSNPSAPVRPNISITPKAGEGLFASGTIVQPDGRFQSGSVPPGDYVLIARFNDPANPGSPPMLARAEVSVAGGDVDGVSLRFAPALELTGRVTVDGVPLGQYLAASISTVNRAAIPAGRPGVIVGTGPSSAAPPQQRKPSLSFLPVEINLGGAPIQAQVEEDGTFHVKGLQQAAYTVQINSFVGGAFMKELRLNGQDITRKRVDLTSASGGTLDVTLSTKGGTLTLTQPPSLPIAAPDPQAPPQLQFVTIWPTVPDLSSQSGGVIVTSTNAQGMTRTPALPPGEYFATMWEENPPQELMRYPDFLQLFNPIARRVTVVEGASLTVEPSVVPKDSLQKALAEFP